MEFVFAGEDVSGRRHSLWMCVENGRVLKNTVRNSAAISFAPAVSI